MNLDDLAVLVSDHQPESTRLGGLAFSVEAWPAALILPPDGVELSNLVDFVEAVLEDKDKGLGYSGVKDFLGPFFKKIPGLKGVYLTRFEVDPDNGGGSAPFFVGFQLKQASWTIIDDSGLPNTKALALSEPGFTVGSLGPEAGYSVDVYGTLEIFGVEFLVAVQWPAKIITGSLVGNLNLQQMLDKTELGTEVKFGESNEKSGLTVQSLMLTIDVNNKALDLSLGLGEWTIPGVELTLHSLLLDLATRPGHKSGSIRAQTTVAGVDLDLSGAFQDGKLSFSGSTGPDQKIPIGELMEDLVHLFNIDADLPGSLKGLTISNLTMSYDSSGAFSFAGEAKLEEVEGKPDITVTVALTHQADGNYEKKFSGVLTIGGAEFTLTFTADERSKELVATWKSGDSGQLNLGGISDELPDLSGLESLLMPASATLKLDLTAGRKSLSLDCTHNNGTKAAFLLAQDSGATPPKWIAALGLKPGKISTESLGLVGDALKPHNIALDKLVVVAASADAPKDLPLPLDGQGYPVSKGLLLRGAVEFEKTSFSYPFECRLGGDERDAQQKALPAGSAAGSTSATTTPATPATSAGSPGQSPEPEEGKNNVAVGRTIGPVTFRKARLESRNKRVYVLLDASLGSGGFDLDLIGFNVNFPLELLQDASKFSELRVGLDGLSITYSKPPLTISGGFAKTAVVKPYVDELYEGSLLIKAETFQITVLGSYGNILINQEKKPSLLLYGTYAGVVGGPAAFYVTGLALGGGYNTRLVIPPVEKVADFPLVQAVTDPAKFKIEALRDVVQPSYGDYWLAVGVKFDSFKIADSFALFTVSFGTRLQFALLGLTKMALPAGAEKGKAAIYAELAIRAVLDPEAGVFSIEGRLTDNSYVLSEKLRLTGGFAFFVWFGNAREAGDFVVSLGGYHPDFVRPPHYPVVPRVAIRGRLADGALSITGEAYLALTPSCLMAGQKLEAVFEAGPVTATFVAYADFLIAWAPFHYDARIGVGISVAVRLFRTFKLEVSAALHVWGPPFAGVAEVSVSIISFTVEFGDHSGAQPPPLTWVEFQQAFLPSPDPKAENGLLSTIRITEGLVRELKKDKVMYRIVNPHELMIETDSAVPCSEVRVGTTTPSTGKAALGIRPMDARTLESKHVVTINRVVGADPVEGRFSPVQWSRKNYPEALWSASAASGKPEAGMVEGVPSGVVLRVTPITPVHPLGPFLIKKFKYEPIPKDIPWLSAPPVPSAVTEKFSGLPAVNQLRSQIRDCLAGRVAEPGKSSWNEIAMTNTSANSSEYFQAPPMCAALGQSL